MTSNGQPIDETLFEWIEQERIRLADVLSTLSPAQCSTPSWCRGWTVAECAAHLTVGFNVSLAKFGLQIVKSRGSFDSANDKLARRLGEQGIERTVDDLRGNAAHRFTPPGAGPEAPLSDVVIHSQDMFRPLGIDHGIEAPVLEVVLGSAASSQSRKLMSGPKLDGLQLVADDMEWTLGEGTEVTGSALAIAMVLAGRHQAIDDLAGPGLDTLRSRLS